MGLGIECGEVKWLFFVFLEGFRGVGLISLFFFFGFLILLGAKFFRFCMVSLFTG